MMFILVYVFIDILAYVCTYSFMVYTYVQLYVLIFTELAERVEYGNVYRLKQ